MPSKLSLPLVWAIRGYQIGISPLFPPSCRFRPTCSYYSLEAIQRFGAVKGSYLAVRRICRCHPWNPGGVDPVPETWDEFRNSFSNQIGPPESQDTDTVGDSFSPVEFTEVPTEPPSGATLDRAADYPPQEANTTEP